MPSQPILLQCAPGLVVGVLVVQQCDVLPRTEWFFVFISFLLVSSYWKHYFFSACMVGIVWASVYATYRSDHIFHSSQRQRVLIEGTVVTIPEYIERAIKFDLYVTKMAEPAGMVLPSRIRLNWYNVSILPKVGEQWRLLVSIRPPHGMLNPGGFDYEQWLFMQGITAVGYVRESQENTRVQPNTLFSFGSWRQKVYDRLTAVLQDRPVSGIINALTMGADQDITSAQWEVLRKTGTMHLIAVSGSHISLIAGLVFFLTQYVTAWLRITRVSPPRLAALVAFVAAFFYSALADFSIPTQRALVMVSVLMGAVFWQRALNWLHVLATAAVALVIYDPLSVLAPGFWLSFGAVVFIAVGISGRIAVLKGARALITINWVVALGLFPLLLLFFQKVSLISPLANLLAVPILGTLLVPLCLLGVALLPLIPSLGSVLLSGAATTLEYTWPVLEKLSQWPLSQWTHAEPPFLAIVLAFLGVLWAIMPRGFPARWLGILCCLPVVLFEPKRPGFGEFRLILLDVGQGLASVVETSHRVLIFDTGTRFGPSFDMGSAVIGPYLQHRGLNQIDVLVVSHGDLDHIGGAKTLLSDFPVARIITSVPEKLSGFETYTCAPRQKWVWDGVIFEMLGPIQKNKKENDNSCVLQVRGEKGRALLTGDIQETSEKQLVEKYGKQLRSEILVVPHHGSRTSSSPMFLETVRPHYAFIPVGYFNRFHFPHKEVLQRYADIGTTVFGTMESGALIATVGSSDTMLETERYRYQHRRYWHEH